MLVIGNQHTWPDYREAHLSAHSAFEDSAHKHLLCHVLSHLPHLCFRRLGIQSRATCVDLPLNIWLACEQYDYELPAASRAISFHGVMVKKFISFQPKKLFFFFFLRNRAFSHSFYNMSKTLR